MCVCLKKKLYIFSSNNYTYLKDLPPVMIERTAHEMENQIEVFKLLYLRKITDKLIDRTI